MTENPADPPVLLVEDNPDDAELTLRALRNGKLGNPVVRALDGEEALALLHGAPGLPPLHPAPAIVLLDLHLPKVDGLEVLRAIRSNDSTRELPVVVLTSSLAEAHVVEAESLGILAYLNKPVDVSALAKAVAPMRLGLIIRRSDVDESG
ncbi:MAG: response regulator [Armatimonadetes bacterium]|nr:response regulator [Armatimonadota bacterium]MDE2205352.1 response regulator [Armatimonadota bacterium]